MTWSNALVDGLGKYLPHLLPVDPTLHWANPSGLPDTRPTFDNTPGPYTGPVPTVVHLHGAHVFDDSDGHPEAWFLPPANDISAGYATIGTHYNDCKTHFNARVPDVPYPTGMSVYEYDNRQPSGTLWYHDHTIGITRLNVYAGMAGFYLLRGADEARISAALPTGPFEIPLCIQDRSFNDDGSLFFAGGRDFFDGFTGPYIPESDISPIWMPEFFANTIVVNGNTWPFLNVEPRRYRFRILNACNARTLVLKIVSSLPSDVTSVPPAALPIWQIGADGGFLPAPAQLQKITVMPGQRNDVIVDFTQMGQGTTLYLINEGPEEPYGGGDPFNDFVPSDPLTTGQVMKLNVVPLNSTDSTLVTAYAVGAVAPTPSIRINKTRRLSLNEFDSDILTAPLVGPRGSFLGTVDDSGIPVACQFMDPVTENPRVGDTEVWEFYNFTADAHPMHVHLVQFQLVNRQNLAVGADGISTAPLTLVGKPISPANWERGAKDTVAAYPGMVTRIRMTFDRAGVYMWHCHILDHEDNNMMRPFTVG